MTNSKSSFDFKGEIQSLGEFCKQLKKRIANLENKNVAKTYRSAKKENVAKKNEDDVTQFELYEYPNIDKALRHI